MFTNCPSSGLVPWAAGLFEGEGYVGVNNNYKYPHGTLQLGSTDSDIVYRFHSIVGMGNVYGPFYRGPGKVKERKPIWKWSANGWDKVERLFLLIGPWLGKRRTEKFEEVLALKHANYKPHRLLSIEEKEKITQKYRNGSISQQDLADEYGCHTNTIHRIITEKDGYVRKRGIRISK